VLEWERAASLFFDCEAAVLLGSGYAGGAVMAAALGDDFDVAFVDEQSHANVWDGLAAAGVRVVFFPTATRRVWRRSCRRIWAPGSVRWW
jgi:7-keto-8-aminopelargonate synthetase-like enzyme